MITAFAEHSPKLASGVFVADSALVLGEVSLGADASVWYGAVVRGDVNRIGIGARTNIQDLSLVHVTTAKHETHLGADVTVGHRVVLHGCTIADRVLVGMGAIVMDGVTVGEDCIIGAGALLPPNVSVPPGMLVLGAPAKVVRAVSAAERLEILASAERYVALAARHARECRPAAS